MPTAGPVRVGGATVSGSCVRLTVSVGIRTVTRLLPGLGVVQAAFCSVFAMQAASSFMSGCATT